MALPIFELVAIILILVGVIGSLTPMVPGSIISLIGVTVYWWSTGFTDPSILFIILIFLTGITALVFDWFAGYFSAKISGASNRTSIAAGIAGLILFFLAGPVGVIIGVAGVVFLREYLRTGKQKASLKSAIYTTIGMLGSTIAQFLLNLTILVLFVVGLII